MDKLLSSAPQRALSCRHPHRSPRQKLFSNGRTTLHLYPKRSFTSTPLMSAYGLEHLSNDIKGKTARTGQTLNMDDEIESITIQPHHMHVYATKHNTHITLTRPNRNPIFSLSAGNLGFKKAARGTYDAGYQLGAYVMGRIQQQGLLTEIQKMELILRGFGPGRDAVTKVVLGSEGRNIRDSIVKVTDATRLKFGGTRSPKPRRLG